MVEKAVVGVWLNDGTTGEYVVLRTFNFDILKSLFELDVKVARLLKDTVCGDKVLDDRV